MQRFLTHSKADFFGNFKSAQIRACGALRESLRGSLILKCSPGLPKEVKQNCTPAAWNDMLCTTMQPEWCSQQHWEKIKAVSGLIPLERERVLWRCVIWEVPSNPLGRKTVAGHFGLWFQPANPPVSHYAPGTLGCKEKKKGLLTVIREIVYVYDKQDF